MQTIANISNKRPKIKLVALAMFAVDATNCICTRLSLSWEIATRILHCQENQLPACQIYLHVLLVQHAGYNVGKTKPS